MLLEDFVSKYLGKKVDVDGAYGGQCVDLFRQYVEEVLELPQPVPVIGAKNIWENYDIDKNLYLYYEKISNSPLGVPQKGDIVVWNATVGNGFGHVSIFLEGGVMSFKSFDQNWPTKDVCTITEHNYRGVYGWLRPKITKEAIETLKKEVERLKNELATLQDHSERWLDALEMLGLPSNSTWKAYKAEVNGLFDTIEKQEKKIEELENAIANNVTNLDAKKDGKYIYSMTDLVNEILRRFKGGDF